MKFRLFTSRLTWPVFFVVMMLQRSPVVRYLADIELSLIPRVQHLWTIAVGAVTVGAYNSVTAASGDVIFGPGENKTSVSLGESVLIVVDIDGGAHFPNTWNVIGDPPAGVETDINFGSGLVTFSGNPTESGSFPIRVQAWRGSDMRGARGDDLVFTITVDPLIGQQPSNQEVDLGGSPEFSVSVNDLQGVTFQWQRQSISNPEQFDDLPDQTDSELNLNNVTLDDSGNYRVVVTKDSITEISDVVMLTVNSLIAEHPANQSVEWNEATELTILMKNPEGVTYQWQKQNSENPELFDDLPGQTGAALSLTNARSADYGNYKVIATKALVMEVSEIALLTVNSTPFQTWLDTHFEDPLSVEAGEEQNNDSDNFINLVESLFGGDPMTADSFQFPEVSQEVIGEARYAVFRYPAVPAGTESQITPEATVDLAGDSWAPLQNGVAGIIIESTAEGYFVKMPADVRQYLRLIIASAL